jgi:O-antigen/teichoic acid export membrane protein
MARVGRKLALGSSFNSAYLLATAATSFFVTPFFVHRLGDHRFGIWTLVVVFTGAYDVLELGLSSAVGRFMAGALGAGDNDRSNAIFNTSLIVFGAAGVVALLVSIVAAAFTPIIVHNALDAAVFREAVLILGLNVALNFPLRVCRAVLQAHLHFANVVWVDMVYLFMRTSLAVGFVLLGYRVVGLALATLIAVIPSLFLYPYFISRNLPFLRLSAHQWHLSLAKDLFSYGLYTFLGFLGAFLRSKSNPFIVASFLGVTMVTHLRFAGMASTYYAELVTALISVFQPLLSQQQGTGDLMAMRRTTIFATKIALCISAFFAFGAIGFGRLLLTRWVGQAYLDAYPCMVLLVLSQALAVSQRPSTYAIFAVARHQFLGYLIVMEGVANIILALLLVPHWRLTGVGCAVLIPIAVSKLVVQPIYACRVIGLSYRDYMRTVVVALVKVVLALVLPTLIVFRLARPDYKSVLFLGTVSLILYSLPVITTVLNRDESQLVMRTVLPAWAARAINAL